MLPKRKKLSRTSFPRRKEPKFSWSGKVLRVYAYKGDDENLSHHKGTSYSQSSGAHKWTIGSRFAVVVPKRLSASVVLRNAFKRQVMVAIGESMARFERLSYKKYIIFPIAHIRASVAEKIKEDLRFFLEKSQKNEDDT